MNRSFRVPAFSLLTLLGLALTDPAGAAGTPAGTQLSNQAQASGLTGDAQTPVTALSNMVSTTVSPLCSVSVTPDGTAAAPGQQQDRVARRERHVWLPGRQ